jgi:hypothetical protein
LMKQVESKNVNITKEIENLRLQWARKVTILKGEKGSRGENGDLVSIPPEGCFKVINFYVNANGKFVIEYNNVPV